MATGVPGLSRVARGQSLGVQEYDVDPALAPREEENQQEAGLHAPGLATLL